MAMVHYEVGNIGHFCTTLSFVSSLTATLSYYMAAVSSPEKTLAWKRYARASFLIHGLAVLGIMASLFYLIYNHYYEYHYAWNYSSDSLPMHFVVSTFWNGQEGGFLLWIFWQVVLGTALIVTSKSWESALMTPFMAVQAFLCSMVLGVVFFGTFKLGSSPFTLLRDAMADAPIFASNPEFVPEDGQGLNPTLQNYWMVIHPPTLFLGFASTVLPFVFCIAGLWQRKTREWVKLALPWTLFSVCILGIGIMMGAYWAYETLNFGGYWNWDPVENASYIPWLMLVAAIHTMIIHQKNGTALKATVILSLSVFVLVLYASFLTRSGVLSEVSNHSFTDLGLSGQLLAFLLFFTLLAVLVSVLNWKYLPTTQEEVAVYSREFWIFNGVMVLALMSFQVLVYTSIPAVKALIESFGFVSKLAPPSDQVGFNAAFQLWFAIGISLLSSVGILVYYGKIDKYKGWKALLGPLVMAVLITLIGIMAGNMKEWKYLLLLLSAAFSLTANGQILFDLLKSRIPIAGGAVAHMGAALMLLGILFSAGYSKAVSVNTSGLLIFREDSLSQNGESVNKENTLLWIDEPTRMDKYWLTYKGKRMELRNAPGYYHKDWFRPTAVSYKHIALKDLVWEGKTYYKQGDTVETYPENTYYEIECRDEKGRIFHLYPRFQVNRQMGNLISPDVRKEWGRDIYTHLSGGVGISHERTWSQTQPVQVALKDTFFINDYVAQLEEVKPTQVPGMDMGKNDAAVKATIKVATKNTDYLLEPVFIIKDGMVGMPSTTLDELGIRMAFTNIDPKTGTFSFAVNTAQKDFIVLKALEKPFINLLWIGVLVMVIGFLLALFRRTGELKKSRLKEDMVPAE